jgi:carbonic anhydrase/acetyltransferase-like protein (isoleucine patch superfamily)
LVGSYTNIQDAAILHVSHDGPFAPGGFRLTIGDYVTVGHRVILHGCTVGDECLIGMGATVLDGAVLAPKVLLAAGALVPAGKVLQGGYLWAGVPARQVRALTVPEFQMLRYSAEHYAQLKEDHRPPQAGT